jgi:hypothetical protein
MEPSGQPTRRGKIRWLWVVAVVAVFCITAATRWPSKPLPPPVVSLSLVGFKVFLTNTYAVMTMTNLGPTKVYFRSDTWRAEFETSEGVITNQPYFWKSEAFPRRRGEGGSFNIGVPDGVIRWRVVSSYEWLDRRKPRIEIGEWLNQHLRVDYERTREVLRAVIRPVVGTLPEEFELHNFVATPWLTNLPPAAASPE